VSNLPGNSFKVTNRGQKLSSSIPNSVQEINEQRNITSSILRKVRK